MPIDLQEREKSKLYVFLALIAVGLIYAGVTIREHGGLIAAVEYTHLDFWFWYGICLLWPLLAIVLFFSKNSKSSNMLIDIVKAVFFSATIVVSLGFACLGFIVVNVLIFGLLFKACGGGMECGKYLSKIQSENGFIDEIPAKLCSCSESGLIVCPGP